MGAIIGGLYAAGYSMEQCMALCDSLHMFNIAKWSERPLRKGLHSGIFRQRIEEHLKPLLGERTIGDCVIPFVCVAGLVQNPIKWRKIVTEGFVEHVRESVELYVFPPETRLLDAMLASSAIPVLFAPVELNGRIFVDLCTFGAIPARTLRRLQNPQIVIGTDTTPEYAIAPYLPRGWKMFLDAAREELHKSREACDLVITPELPTAPFRFDRATDFVEAGKVATQEAIPAIRTLLKTNV